MKPLTFLDLRALRLLLREVGGMCRMKTPSLGTNLPRTPIEIPAITLAEPLLVMLRDAEAMTMTTRRRTTEVMVARIDVVMYLLHAVAMTSITRTSLCAVRGLQVSESGAPVAPAKEMTRMTTESLSVIVGSRHEKLADLVAMRTMMGMRTPTEETRTPIAEQLPVIIEEMRTGKMIAPRPLDVEESTIEDDLKKTRKTMTMVESVKDGEVLTVEDGTNARAILPRPSPRKCPLSAWILAICSDSSPPQCQSARVLYSATFVETAVALINYFLSTRSI